jgi:hypothetical protein
MECPHCGRMVPKESKHVAECYLSARQGMIPISNTFSSSGAYAKHFNAVMKSDSIISETVSITENEIKELRHQDGSITFKQYFEYCLKMGNDKYEFTHTYSEENRFEDEIEDVFMVLRLYGPIKPYKRGYIFSICVMIVQTDSRGNKTVDDNYFGEMYYCTMDTDRQFNGRLYAREDNGNYTLSNELVVVLLSKMFSDVKTEYETLLSKFNVENFGDMMESYDMRLSRVLWKNDIDDIRTDDTSRVMIQGFLNLIEYNQCHIDHMTNFIVGTLKMYCWSDIISVRMIIAAIKKFYAYCDGGKNGHKLKLSISHDLYATDKFEIIKFMPDELVSTFDKFIPAYTEFLSTVETNVVDAIYKDILKDQHDQEEFDKLRKRYSSIFKIPQAV